MPRIGGRLLVTVHTHEFMYKLYNMPGRLSRRRYGHTGSTVSPYVQAGTADGTTSGISLKRSHNDVARYHAEGPSSQPFC